ncbi:hypothetical protein Purlil1_11156 [Purpureocillium lilacinum]|uniref:Ubiquinone biosynthesis protein n=3 Tax=Purpureocillium lilacinum TaxID=33203 RepID=A0ABR0BKJ8_PURLI|nr:hypothetical protein Purlil1_11156 [Purpureocillium lilacinum]
MREPARKQETESGQGGRAERADVPMANVARLRAMGNGNRGDGQGKEGKGKAVGRGRRRGRSSCAVQQSLSARADGTLPSFSGGHGANTVWESQERHDVLWVRGWASRQSGRARYGDTVALETASGARRGDARRSGQRPSEERRDGSRSARNRGWRPRRYPPPEGGAGACAVGREREPEEGERDEQREGNGATTKSSPYEVLDGAREEFKGGQCLGLYAVSPHNGRLCVWPVGQVDEIRREKMRPQSVMEGAETSTEHGRAGGAIPSQRELMSERCSRAAHVLESLARPRGQRDPPYLQVARPSRADPSSQTLPRAATGLDAGCGILEGAQDGWMAGWLAGARLHDRALLAAANEQWPPGSGLSVMSVKVAGREEEELERSPRSLGCWEETRQGLAIMGHAMLTDLYLGCLTSVTLRCGIAPSPEPNVRFALCRHHQLARTRREVWCPDERRTVRYSHPEAVKPASAAAACSSHSLARTTRVQSGTQQPVVQTGSTQGTNLLRYSASTPALPAPPSLGRVPGVPSASMAAADGILDVMEGPGSSLSTSRTWSERHRHPPDKDCAPRRASGMQAAGAPRNDGGYRVSCWCVFANRCCSAHGLTTACRRKRLRWRTAVRVAARVGRKVLSGRVEGGTRGTGQDSGIPSLAGTNLEVPSQYLQSVSRRRASGIRSYLAATKSGLARRWVRSFLQLRKAPTPVGSRPVPSFRPRHASSGVWTQNQPRPSTRRRKPHARATRRRKPRSHRVNPLPPADEQSTSSTRSRPIVAGAPPSIPPLAMSLCCTSSRAAALRLAAAAARRSRGACARHRPFHSYDHPAAEGAFGAVENSILAAAYRHVPEHGFSQRALGLGARDAGLLDISPSVLPDGAFSLVLYHLVLQRQALAAQAQRLFGTQSSDAAALGVGAKVTALTWARLMANKDIIHRWQEALAIMAQPSCAPASLKELALLSDEIWFLSGDKSVDPSWYSKRASLSMIYSTTELFMTNDRSPSFSETRRFLDRRLDEVKTVGGAVGALGQWAGFTLSAGVNVLRSKGVGI